MVRIITGETPTEEIQRKFSEELKGMMKDAALKMNCNVNELKYRINNAGIVEIERMDAQDIIDMAAKDAANKRIIKVKKDRGVL